MVMCGIIIIIKETPKCSVNEMRITTFSVSRGEKVFTRDLIDLVSAFCVPLELAPFQG